MSWLKITTQPVGPGFAVVSLCLLLAVPGLSAAATTATVTETAHAPWLAVGATLEGQIYHRAVAGSPLPATMIVTRFAAPPARVHALVTDYGHFAEFIPNVAESRVLLQAGGREWVFHHLHFAGPVADRTYVIESTDAASRPQENYYRVDWKLSSRDFPRHRRKYGDKSARILRLLGLPPDRTWTRHRSPLCRAQRSRRTYPELAGGEDDRPVYSTGDRGSGPTSCGKRGDMKRATRTVRCCLGLHLALVTYLPAAAAEVVRSADGETGLAKWTFTAGDVEIELIQRLPDQTRGFFQARDFPTAVADEIARNCIFQTIIRNKGTSGAGRPVAIDLESWRIRHNGVEGGVKLKEPWLSSWSESAVGRAARLAFQWALFPTRQEFLPGDYNWGMTAYGLSPGTAFDLLVVWRSGGVADSGWIRGIECAPDVEKLK